jgi:hypothetical protein
VPRPRPAAGGGRWVAVAPERLDRWLTGFAERHGDGGWVSRDGVVTVSGVDKATACCHPPFPPLVTDPTLPYDGLLAHALTDRRVGVLLVRRGGHAVGIFAGSALVASKVGSRHVQGRTAAGGWSQHRFARRREGQTQVALGAAADVAARVLVAEAVPPVDHLVTGGDKRLLAEVLEDPRLRVLQVVTSDRVLDVPNPKLDVLRATPAAFRAVRILTRGP